MEIPDQTTVAQSPTTAAPAADTGLRLSDFSVVRGRDQQVVTHLDLTVPQGSLAVVVGPNGAGKTSLLLCLAGEALRQTGGIHWDGAPVPRQSVAARARSVGFVYVGAEHRVFPALSVRDNLVVGAEAVGRRPDAATLDYVLELFPNLSSRLRQVAGTLSGGEQQMVAFGRGLMSQARLLLLDEPSAGLSPVAVAQVADAVTRMVERGATVLLAEQNLELVDRTCGQAHLLQHGALTWTGTTGRLSSTPEVVEAVLGERTGTTSGSTPARRPVLHKVTPSEAGRKT